MLNLKKIEGFDDISNSLIQEINRVGKIKIYAQNLPAMSSEDTQKYFYIILKGCIKIYQYNPLKDKEQTLYLLKNRDFFDVITVLDGKKHEVMSQALETSEVLELPIEKVKEWIKTNPTFNSVFFPYLANQFRQIEELATDLSLLDTSSRLIKLLVKNLTNSTRGLPLLQKLSHEEIASMIGTVRQVVSRQLQELKKDGILNIQRKRIIVEDLNKLIQKAEI